MEILTKLILALNDYDQVNATSPGVTTSWIPNKKTPGQNLWYCSACIYMEPFGEGKVVMATGTSTNSLEEAVQACYDKFVLKVADRKRTKP